MAEESAWDRYRETINNLEKEWEDISIQFTKDRAALLSYYGDKIPDDGETKLAKKRFQLTKAKVLSGIYSVCISYCNASQVSKR